MRVRTNLPPSDIAPTDDNDRSIRLLQGSNDGFWEWPDVAKGEIWWSARVYEMLGYAPNAFIPTRERLLAMVHPDDRAQTASRVEQLAEEKPFQAEYRIQAKSGDYISFQVCGTIFRDASGAPRCVAGSIRDVTERHKASSKLRRNEELFRCVFEDSAIGMATTDLQGQFTRVNNAACEMLGYTREEFLNKDYAGITEPADMELCSQKFNELLDGVSDNYTLDKRYLHKQGHYVWCTVTVSVMRDSLGNPAYVVAQIQDITERKRAEETLQRSEASLLQAQSIAHLGNWEMDAQSTRISWSDEVTRIFGFDPDAVKLTYDTFLNHVHPDDRHLIDELRETLATKGESNFEYRAVRASGEIRWISGRGKTALNDAGEPATMFGVLQDVTDRKMAVLALQESEETFRSLFDQSPIAIQLYDEAGLLFDVNQRTLDLFGVADKKHLLGYDMWSSPDFAPEIIERVKSGESVCITTEFDFESVKQAKLFPTTKSGILHLDMYVLPLKVAGTITGYTVQLVDMTEPRKIEAQLRHAQRMESIGRLAGGIAHDFNNILVPITCYVELAKQSMKPDHPSYEDLELVGEAAERATSLTRQILAFGRNQVLQTQILDLNEVVSGFEEMLRRSVGESIRLEIHPSSDLYRVEADTGQIEQVLMNLAINARDAMPRGGCLRVETANVELDDSYVAQSTENLQAGRYAMLAVTDTGHGMDAATQKQIFEPFFSAKERGKGTGLGLSTTFGIIKQHGGHIGVYSEPGKGTTFKIYLPRTDAEPKVNPQTLADTSALRGSETILLVEDEKMVRRLVCETLTSLGYEVLEAQHPDQALQLASLHGEAIDLLLTDVVMPGMSGPELHQQLSELLPNIPALYMSGYTDDAIVHHGVVKEGVQFLQKPFTIQSLHQMVRQTLSQNQIFSQDQGTTHAVKAPFLATRRNSPPVK